MCWDRGRSKHARKYKRLGSIYEKTDVIDKDIWDEGNKILLKSSIGLRPTSTFTFEQLEEEARHFHPLPV